MDLNLRGKAWVGNIYQKFENMCYEVDDFVSQDTVKFVENQMQTMGENVKKICSHVVQDLLPPVKHGAQFIPQKQNDTFFRAYVKSMIGIEENLVNVDQKQSSVEQNPFYPLENCDVSPSTAELLKEAEADLSGPDDDNDNDDKALIYTNSGMVADKDLVKEEISQSEESYSPEYNVSVDNACKDGILANVSSVALGQGMELSKDSKFPEGKDLVVGLPLIVPCGEIHKNRIVANVSSASLGQDMELFLFKGLNSLKNKDLEEVLSASESINENHKDRILASFSLTASGHGMELYPYEKPSSLEDGKSRELIALNELIDENQNKAGILANISPAALDQGTELITTQKEERICNRIPDNVECESNVLSSLQSSKLTLDSTQLSESYDLSESLHANLLIESGNNFCNTSDTVGCVSESSHSLVSSKRLTTSIASEDNVANIDLSFSDESAGDRVYWKQSLGSNLPQRETNDFNIDIADPCMETIDLSDTLNLDESCVLVDNKLLYSIPHRAAKVRSYKKLIQDTFASKKRLIKEYEQLAIWYGDDIESSLFMEPCQEHYTPTESLLSKEHAMHDLFDSEWELL